MVVRNMRVTCSTSTTLEWLPLAAVGNPGHDFAIEGGMLDLFAQAARTGEFDEVLAVSRTQTPPPWTVFMLEALFGSGQLLQER